jgi:hypothetical protein
MNDAFGSVEKKVDEDWKERVEREKQALRASRTSSGGSVGLEGGSAQRSHPQAGPSEVKEEPGFSTLISSLGMQALMALGEVPHPETGQPQMDLDQARSLIDLLGVLKRKTQGNLTEEEGRLLDGVLYELRMKYVEKMGPNRSYGG